MLKTKSIKINLNFSKNDRGYAAVEAIMFLVAFMAMAVYAIDYYAAIQTGILGSIEARAYLFETVRHRPNVDYLRRDRSAELQFANTVQGHERIHMITDESLPENNITQIPAVGRTITQADSSFRNQGNVGVGKLGFAEEQKTSTIYVKSGYGICTDAQCAQD